MATFVVCCTVEFDFESNNKDSCCRGGESDWLAVVLDNVFVGECELVDVGGDELFVFNGPFFSTEILIEI